MRARTGNVAAIFIAPAAQTPMQQVWEVMALKGLGLDGDRYAAGAGSYNKGKAGNRQVTLINARFFSDSGFDYSESRRNIVVRDIDLIWLIGKEFRVGAALLGGMKYCDPCEIPSVLAGKARIFEDVFLEGGGLVAEVLESGWIKANDPILAPGRK